MCQREVEVGELVAAGEERGPKVGGTADKGGDALGVGLSEGVERGLKADEASRALGLVNPFKRLPRGLSRRGIGNEREDGVVNGKVDHTQALGHVGGIIGVEAAGKALVIEVGHELLAPKGIVGAVEPLDAKLGRLHYG